jgi:hypothetical protein
MRGDDSVLTPTLNSLQINNIPANIWVDVELSAENTSLFSAHVKVDRGLLKLQ